MKTSLFYILIILLIASTISISLNRRKRNKDYYYDASTGLVAEDFVESIPEEVTVWGTEFNELVEDCLEYCGNVDSCLALTRLGQDPCFASIVGVESVQYVQEYITNWDYNVYDYYDFYEKKNKQRRH